MQQRLRRRLQRPLMRQPHRHGLCLFACAYESCCCWLSCCFSCCSPTSCCFGCGASARYDDAACANACDRGCGFGCACAPCCGVGDPDYRCGFATCAATCGADRPSYSFCPCFYCGYDSCRSHVFAPGDLSCGFRLDARRQPRGALSAHECRRCSYPYCAPCLCHGHACVALPCRRLSKHSMKIGTEAGRLTKSRLSECSL